MKKSIRTASLVAQRQETFDKAVRDNIPKRLKSSNVQYVVVRSPHKIFLKHLANKLGEEAREAATAISFSCVNFPEISKQGKVCIANELADIIEVVLAVGKLCHISGRKIELARRKKLKSSGGFSKRYVLHSAAVGDGR